MTAAWDKFQAVQNGWSPEEVDIIYADYEKYPDLYTLRLDYCI